MYKLSDKLHNSKGFALIIVLGGLAILTTLFAVIMTRSQADLSELVTLTALSDRQRADLAALEHALQMGEIDGSIITGQTLHLEDLGGRVDLNTATPALIQALLDHMEADGEALIRWRAWRRAPHRFLRVSDFLSVTGVDSSHREWLRQVATVHSGRRGLAPSHVPPALLVAFPGSVVPSELHDMPNGRNFAVILVEETGERQVGVISRRPGGGGRILE